MLVLCLIFPFQKELQNEAHLEWNGIKETQMVETRIPHSGWR